MFSLPPETRQETRARKKQEKAALEAEALALALVEAKTELPWRILELISKAQAAGTPFSLKAPNCDSDWELSFPENNNLIKFSSTGLTSQAELNNLEFPLNQAEFTLDQILKDQALAKLRETRKAELLASISAEDQEILGLTPKSSHWPY
jgi:hypothetical protein